MIHYTLLPQEEMKALRREYRMRLCIIAAFFVSCGVLVGIISLIPSYIYTSIEDNETSQRVEKWQEGRKASGLDQIEKDLAQTRIVAERILAEEDKVSYSGTLEKIISVRPSQITISSFELSRGVGTTTPYGVVVQGKALTREALLDFKESLEDDTAFSKVELPLSDLAKNKNVNFAIKLDMK